MAADDIVLFECPVHGWFEDFECAAPGWCPQCDAKVVPAASAPTASTPTFCDGCGGTGRIFNPNKRDVERHVTCNGEGVRR